MEIEPAAKTANHLGFLDGIRGAAALYVMLAHCMIWGGWYWNPLPNAKIAVDIFMVLSGFLMVFHYRVREGTEPIESWRTAARFWVRRYFRVAPVYYLLLAIVYVSWGTLVQGYTTLQQINPDQWQKPSIYDPDHYQMDWVNVLVHASFLFGLSPQYAFSNMTPDWSIGLEMQFYAAFPVLYVLLRRYSWVWIAMVSLALSMVCNRLFLALPGALPGTLGLFPEPSFLLMKLPLFIVGMLACEIYCLHQQAPGKCVLMTMGVLLVTATYAIWVSIATGIILWLAWSRAAEAGDGLDWIRRWLEASLSNRYAKLMADCSYCVYLMHGLLISALGGGWLFLNPAFLSLSPPSA